MVDSNVQREEILPSEKAFALKMKMDAMKHQGFRSDLTSDQNEPKSTSDQNGPRLVSNQIGNGYGMSSSQVKRYIRLTHLLPDLLELVDKGKIKLTNAVEVSFLSVDVQKQILAYIKDGNLLTKNKIMQLRDYDESLTLNERLNSEKRVGNIQALKNDLRKTKELLQSEKEKTLTAKDMIEECRDKLRQAEQERDYALSHQKKVEIPVEKPVLYQKCQNCNQTAYLKAKERYDTQREKMAGRYKAKTAMYEALMFLLIWYSASTTLFQMIQSKVFISDCRIFFGAIGTFTQTIAGWIALIGKNVAQISNGISNPVIAGIIYWLIRILICGGCLVGAGILVAFIGIKIAGLYKKYCWDMITILVTLISLEIAIYFGDWIKTVLPINMLFLLLLVQLVYVGIRWYVKGWQEARGYY